MGFKNKLIYTTLTIIFITYAPNLPPHAEFDIHEYIPGRPLEGIFAENDILDSGEKLHEGVLLGPESIASRSSDELFVGIYGGDIVKVYGSDFEKTKVVARYGPGCAGFWEEAKCGRPLGIRFHKNGLLYVTDAYLGVFAVDVDTGKSTNIFDLTEPINGAIPRLADDLDFDNEGNIYWSDASTVASLDSGALEIYAQPSGRLIKYDIKTKKQTVLVDRIHFANGVQLSPNKDFVLVNETPRKRTVRYWLKGPKAGTQDLFVSDLPGMPDNLRPRPEGGYYIAIVSMDDPLHRQLFTFFSTRPIFKRFLCRVTAIMAWVAQKVDDVIPNYYCKNFVYGAFNIGTLARWTENEKAIVLEVDEDGVILGSLQGSNGQIKRVTEAQPVGDYLFFATVFHNYLGRVSLTSIQKAKNEATPTSTDKNYERYEL